MRKNNFKSEFSVEIFRKTNQNLSSQLHYLRNTLPHKQNILPTSVVLDILPLLRKKTKSSDCMSVEQIIIFLKKSIKSYIERFLI